MSTRTNIVVKLGDTIIYVYRHCDGYPAETGADILAKLRDASGTPEMRYTPEASAAKFMRDLLNETYEQQSYEKAPRHVYELTTEIHGDIEHCYTVNFGPQFNCGSISIRHAERPENWHSEGVESEDWALTGKRYSLEDFAKVVNADRRSINRRLAQLRQEQPNAYKDCADYPMVPQADFDSWIKAA